MRIYNTLKQVTHTDLFKLTKQKMFKFVDYLFINIIFKRHTAMKILD